MIEAVTGCRPAELVKGVRIEVADGELVLQIIGPAVRVPKPDCCLAIAGARERTASPSPSTSHMLRPAHR